MKILISFVMLLMTTVGHAQSVKVPGVWGFAVGSTQGTYFRAILEQANKEQNKYEFVFEHKPGAGGSIASKYVFDQHPRVVVLAHSSAYFIRPYLYPDTIYNFEQFKPLMIMGFASAVLVTKQKTLEQLLKQPRIILGTAGPGSSTHLIAETFAKELRGKEITMVHFKDTNEAFVNVMGGHIDATFEFLGDAKARATNETSLLGLTGKIRHEGLPLLRDLGFKDMVNLSTIFAIYVNRQMPESTVKELQTILLKAEKHESVQRLYKSDYTSKDAFMQNPSDLTEWYNETIKQFRGLTVGIKVQ